MLYAEHPMLVLGFLGVLLLALFQPLDMRPLRVEEPRRSIVAMEMEYSGNYLVPKVNDMYYYNKPPLYNWVLVGCFKLFGSYDEWIVRLPTVFSLLFTALLNFFFVRRYANEQIALLSSLFYVLSADILLFFSMLGEIDMFYSMLVYVQVVAIFHFFQRKQWLSLFLLSYAFTALGVLTKGVPSLAFQALTLLAIFSYNKQFWRLLWWQHLAGILLLVAMVGGYFYAYAQSPHSGDVGVYLTKLFVESSSRTGLETGIGDIIANCFRIPGILLKLFLPWSFLFVLLFRKDGRQVFLEHPLLKFCFYFLVVNLLVYCFSPGTRERYLYMFLPFMGIIVAWFYDRFGQEKSVQNKIIRTIVFGLLGIITIAFVALAFIPDLEAVPYLYLLSFMAAAVMAYLILRYRQRHISTVWALLLTMLILRLGVNCILTPYQNSTTIKFREINDAQKMVEMTGGQPIYLAGGLWREQPTFKLGERIIFQKNVRYATEFHFMMTYYIMRFQKEPVRYQTDLKEGLFYVGKKYFALEQQAEILYEFSTNGRDHCLFQLNSKQNKNE